MKNPFNRIIIFTFAIIALMLIANITFAEDSFENTIKKINILENGDNKVEYDKIQPIKDQYCFIKVKITEVDGEIIKEEVQKMREGNFQEEYCRNNPEAEGCLEYWQGVSSNKDPSS